MKQKISFIAVMMIILMGCKRNEIEALPLATVSVLNAVNDGKVARLNTNLRDSCLNMAFKHFSIVAGNSSPIKLYSSGAPSMTYFEQRPDTKAGDIYSLFLTGSHSAPESVLIKEAIPPYPVADVINLRLVNLSPNSPAVSLTIVSPTSSNLFNNISYKQVSEFTTVQIPVATPEIEYVFQIKNEVGTILGTYTLPVAGTVSVTSSRHRNITLAVKGMVGGTGASTFGIIALPHY